MRAALALALLVLASGCLSESKGAPPGGSDDASGEPMTIDYRLKPGLLLSRLGPASQAPQKVYAAPTANAYATEDLEVFTSTPLDEGLVVRSLTFEVHYAVDRPTGDVFRNGTDPLDTRHFVFWVGSDGIYPVFETVWGPPILQPGTTYKGELTFRLPAGGWHVPAGEGLQLLVAPLVAQAGPQNVHYLVDHALADSRLTLNATRWAPAELGREEETEERITVAGNSGLFTGAGPPEFSTVDRPVELRASDGYVLIDVRFESTRGGKSDLDLTLLDASGTVVSASTTPYQSETIRLHRGELEALGGGTFTIHVDAYSGLDTAFRLVTVRAPLA